MMKLLKAGPIIGRCYQAEPRRRNPVGAAGRSWSGCVLAFVESGVGNPPVLPGCCPRSDNISPGDIVRRSIEMLRARGVEESARMGSISFLWVMKIVRAELAFENASGACFAALP
jgi:hypothetical protein